MKSQQRMAVVLGAADGLTLALSELIGLRLHQSAIFSAGLSAGLGELVGMAAALWLSSESKSSFLAAAACGSATLLACVLPCIPYAITGGATALLIASVIGIALGAGVCWLRPEKGFKAIAETYGVLIAAGVLCYTATVIRI